MVDSRLSFLQVDGIHRLGFHVSVWLYIALANTAYFLVFFTKQYPLDAGSGGTENVAATDVGISNIKSMEKVDRSAVRMLTWLMAGFVGHVVTAYYINVRWKASEMIQGLVHFVDGISISVDYNSPRASVFLNELYGAMMATAHYALAHASANTKFKLQKDELQAIFDNHGYDGKYMISLQKKQTVTVMRLAILRSLEEEKDASESCLKKSYNNFREENIRQSLTQFAAGAMSTISSVSCNKLPFAYVHLLTWATRTFLLFHIFLSYVLFAIEHVRIGRKTAFSCYDSLFVIDGVDVTCITEEFIIFNAFNIVAVYFKMGVLEVYPTLMKTWQSQLVLKNYKLVIDLICEPLKPDTYGQPKNLSQLKQVIEEQQDVVKI